MPTRRRDWAYAGATGVALGVLAELVLYLARPWLFLGLVATPWLAAAFWQGRRLSNSILRSVLAGTLTIAIGLTANYALKRLAYGYDSVRPLQQEAKYWVALLLVTGPTAGWCGWLSTRRDTLAAAAGWGLLLGTIAGEALSIARGALSFPSSVALLVSGFLTGGLVWMFLVASKRVVFYALVIAVIWGALVAIVAGPLARALHAY